MTEASEESRRPSLRCSMGAGRAAGSAKRVAESEAAVLERPFVNVGVGRLHVLALKRDGSLEGRGSNSSGQLGLGDGNHRARPTRIGGDSDWTAVVAGFGHTLAVRRDGTLWAWGLNYNGQLGLGDAKDRSGPTRVPS